MMGLGGYVLGGTSLVAGFLMLLQPPLSGETSGPGWWQSLAGWLQPNPTPSYSKLPIFGAQADLSLKLSHSLQRTGFHRRYQLAVELIKERAEVELDGCEAVAEWRFTRDFIIDQWLLHRTTKTRWTLSETVDLELPSYDPGSKDFVLRGHQPLQNNTTRLVFEIPDVQIRYHLPSTHSAHSERLTLLPPKIDLRCSNAQHMVMRGEEAAPGALRELQMTVPVAKPLLWVNHGTIATVVLSFLYLLLQLYKA